MAAVAGHFKVQKDDAGTAGKEDVPAREQEFIELALPGKVYIKPVFDPIGKDGSLVEQLELPEWTLGFVAVADAAAGSHDITVNALLKLAGVGGGETAIPVRALSGAAVEWNELAIWWDANPISFKSEIEIDVTGAGTVRLVTRIIPRSQLRTF